MLVGGIRPHYYCLPILKRNRHQQALRDAGIPTVPSHIGLELATNPCLRCEQRELLDSLQMQGRLEGTAAAEVFATVRGWKDNF